MSGIFGTDYAAAYDLLYGDKDYDAECDLLQAQFLSARGPVRSALDVGCGTGAHAVRLAARGYEVVGVDLSEEMLATARQRADASGLGALELRLGDLRSVRLGRTFDAVICMFAVLGYQTSDDDVAGALATVRAHLRPGGIFVFDVWYGPAVEATGPSERVKTVSTGDGEIERRATAELEPSRHLCTVSYHLVRRSPGIPDVAADEEHRMRYFSADELAISLADADLQLIDLVPFPETAAELSTETWNAMGTAAG